MSTELLAPLDLSTAYASWVNGEHDNQWVIYNAQAEIIHKLPAGLNETKVMAAIRMGRIFELKAFNTGIDFGKREKQKMLQPEIDWYKNQTERLKQENERLCRRLETLITGET